MKLTIDQMLQKIAQMVEEELTKTDGTYTGDNLVLAQTFLDGINVALEKIIREKLLLKTKEMISIDTDGIFNVSVLTKNCIKINKITYQDSEYEFEILEDGNIHIDSLYSKDDVYISYNYLINSYTISDLATTPSVDFDHLILCYYSSYYYLMLTAADTKNYLNLFNEGYSNIKKLSKSKRVGKHD